MMDIFFNQELLKFKVPPALTQFFLNKFYKNLCTCVEEPNTGNFSLQKFFLAMQVANAARALGTINDKTTLEELFYLKSQRNKTAALRKFKIDS